MPGPPWLHRPGTRIFAVSEYFTSTRPFITKNQSKPPSVLEAPCPAVTATACSCSQGTGCFKLDLRQTPHQRQG